MDPSSLVSTVQAGGGVMVWGIFSWHTLGPLVPIKHCLNATATVTRSQSNRAPLGCDVMGDLHNGCAADKSAAAA